MSAQRTGPGETESRRVGGTESRRLSEPEFHRVGETEFHRGWPSIISRRQFLLVIGLAVLGLVVVSFGRLVLVSYEENRQSQALRAEIAALETENHDLQEQLSYWESDQGLEELARAQLGWTRPGETLVVVVPNGAGESATVAAPKPADEGSMPLRWWRLFVGD